MARNQIVVLDRGDQTTCTVNLQGATVTSWRIKDREQLFVRRQTPSHENGYIKGSIQLLFPHFGTWSFGPKQGFARTLRWVLEQEPKKSDTGEVCAEFSLSDNAYTHALWGYKFKLRYVVCLDKTKLTFKVYLENVCKTVPFDFHLMQNSFFRVPDVTKCEVTGLQSLLYKDDTCDRDKFYVEDNDTLILCGQTSRLYKNVSDDVTVKHLAGGNMMKIQQKRATDFNLWNPGAEQAIMMDELGTEDYKELLCIKSGLLSEPFRLEPLSSWETSYSFEIIEPKQEKHFYDEFYDFFKGFC